MRDCQWILTGGDLMKNKTLAKFWKTFPQNADQLQRKKVNLICKESGMHPHDRVIMGHVTSGRTGRHLVPLA